MPVVSIRGMLQFGYELHPETCVFAHLVPRYLGVYRNFWIWSLAGICANTIGMGFEAYMLSLLPIELFTSCLCDVLISHPLTTRYPL